MPELARLLRAKNMIDSAVASVTPDATAARGLTDSYMRLRAEIADLIEESELVDEFERIFPMIDIAEAPNTRLALASRHQNQVSLEAEAKRASALLGQLAGWVAGLIDEQLLERRIIAEAEAKARLEARPATGFERPSSA